MDEEKIFLRAVELEDHDERIAFLDDACGIDRRLRANVESLLEHHAAADRFLEKPPAELQQTFAAWQGDTVENGPHDRLRELLAPCEKPGRIGQLGPYEILEVIGRGGMGIVLHAHDPKLNRNVAIKVLATAGTPSADAVKRFVREAQAAAAVKHDHIVTIHAINDDVTPPYIVMEFVEGISLQQQIDRSGALAISEILRIGSQIAAGLNAAHQRGLVHRDIKPANILLEAGTGRVKITDFGLARAVDDGDLSWEGQIAGTPQFMSPEQAQGRKADHRSDLFSLGSVLYTICTGRAAFPAETALATLRGICDDAPPPIREFNASVPKWLDEIICQLLEKDPDRRPQSACEVADLLGRNLAQLQSSSSFLPTIDENRVVASRRNRWTLTALGGVAAILLAGVIIVIKSRDGKLTRIEVPDGSDVKVTAAGDVEVDLPGARFRSSAIGAAPNEMKDTPTVARGEWERSVSTLAADAQVDAISNRLKQLNVGFDGHVIPTIENGVVTRLEIVADDVTNLTPVRVLKKLRSLSCRGSSFEASAKLADMSPLHGLSLTSLDCSRTQVSDLSPLKGMRLEKLNCADTQVQDLSPLNGMPLRDLSFQATRVSDLTPLTGMPLIALNCSHTPVADFSALKDLKLESMICDRTRAKDLSPLREMPLRVLNWRGYDHGDDSHRQIVKSITTLETINSQPASEFWKQTDRQRE